MARPREVYRPYAKQQEFHAAGLVHRERLFLAGNQLGKTLAGGHEEAIHSTGDYPPWWRGRRFDGPTNSWVAGVTGESTRDNVQRILLGRPGQFGTGAVPKSAIIETRLARGIADLVDTVRIRHVSGGVSTIAFKSYEKGREKWQGETLHRVWFDEEPPADIYSEGLTRTNATGGIVWLTMTPLLGMSEVVRSFLEAPTPDRHVTQMTIDDAEHYTAAERARIVASYPPHEREARAKGIPVLGSGRIFPMSEEAIAIEPFEIPRHWPQIGGIDFGWDHPTAAIRLAFDRDADCIYVTHAYRLREATPVLHAATLRAWGAWLPWAWPHDGLQHSKDSGEQLAEQYRREGLAMLAERAMFDNVANAVTPQITGSFEGAGRYGSGAYANALTSALSNTAGNLAYQNYANERQNMTRATALAPTLANQDYANLQQLASVGDARQQLGQQQINADINRYNYDQNLPYNNLANYMRMIQGNYGTSATQTTQNAVNPLAGTLGLGNSALDALPQLASLAFLLA
jgi:phage terminase large subunit-like protein